MIPCVTSCPLALRVPNDLFERYVGSAACFKFVCLRFNPIESQFVRFYRKPRLTSPSESHLSSLLVVHTVYKKPVFKRHLRVRYEFQPRTRCVFWTRCNAWARQLTPH